MTQAFGRRALLARAGLILGPYEIVGRMPWWLRRIERGGDVLAPGAAGPAAAVHRLPRPGCCGRPPDSELAGLHTGDVSAAHAAGLACRPVEDTVRDTWAWLQAEGGPPPRPGRPVHGV
ncbi:MAG: reductase, partial [Streptosporangiales bacterium]